MAHICILYGGRSGEHEVSRRSASSVLAELASHHDVMLIGIDRDGTWYLQDRPEPIPAVLDLRVDPAMRIAVVPGRGLASADGIDRRVDVVLPVLHGSYGEDGCVQGLLESARLPYAGSGVLGSAVGMDKEMAKRIWREAGLPVIPWRSLVGNFTPKRAAAEAAADLGFPLFVKPANAGSSVGVSRADDVDGLAAALVQARRYDRKILVEQAVEGREIECAVMGRDDPESFPPGEVIPAGNHRFYDYDAKYTDPDGALLKVPAELPAALAQRIRSTAERAYRAVEARGLARVDFLLRRSDGALFINEINTMPGMTSISLFPRMAAAGGLDFTAVLERLIDEARDEAAWRNGLSYNH